MNIFVGSLSYDVSETEFKELFEAYGEVTSAKIITDRDTGRSKGFGFIEMENGQEAIDALNGKDVGGRTIVVNEARPREERPKRNFGGGGNRGGRY